MNNSLSRRNMLAMFGIAVTAIAVGTTAASAQQSRQRRVRRRAAAPAGSAGPSAPLGRIEQPNPACLSLRQGSPLFAQLGCRTTGGRGGFVR